MKKIVYAILIIFLSLPLSGYTIKGGVTYTVEQARQEAFANVEYTLPQSIIDANKVDPNYDENMKAKAKGKKKFRDRVVVFFSNGGYAIGYYGNRYYEFYYCDNGELNQIGKRTGLVRPCKSYKYNVKGVLEEVVLYADRENSYIFSPTGQLKVHWFAKKAYDVYGNIVLEKY